MTLEVKPRRLLQSWNALGPSSVMLLGSVTRVRL
jgi:hypothetical protein